jgi:hypothetical protein
MRTKRRGLLAALVLSLPVTATAATIEIRHTPVECVPRDRYARIAATGAPAEGVAAAEVQFRVGAQDAWYSVRMASEGGEWSAFLPRPMRPLAHFEYRIVMRSADLQEAATAPFAVRIGEGSAECGGTQGAVVADAPIVVRVPAGAPVAPPVPPGFSPAGVVAAQEVAPKSGSTKKWIALAGVAGAAAAGAVIAGSAAQPAPLPAGVPAFQFFGANPVPGSVLSLSSDRVSVSLRITGERRFSLDLLWRIDLLGSGESPCAIMFGTRNIDAARPQVADLTARPVTSGACGPRFDVANARITIMIEGQLAYDQTHRLPYHFEP